MRFLMLNWRDPVNPLAGGAERVSLGYLAGLVNRGHEVFWYAYEYPGCKLTEANAGITVVRGGRFASAIVRARRWYQGQERFDLVIDQHHGIPWYALWWCRTNCVAYIHEVLGPIWDSFYPWPLSWIGRWQERWTHWMYRKIPFWVPSVSTKEDLMRNGVRNVTVIPNGIDLVALPELRDKPLKPPVKLIVISRLAPNKRISHAIQALKLLSDNGVDAHLAIVGTGEEERKLRDLTATLRLENRIVLAGQLSETEKNHLLAEAHLLLHTSVREGWGLNVIEANAMGTPAIVYPVRGLIDSTIHDQTGVVTKSETPLELTKAITALIRQPERYEVLRRLAWRRARSFHWENVLPHACEWLESQAGKAG